MKTKSPKFSHGELSYLLLKINLQNIQWTMEIGIRKVLGGSVIGVLFLLLREFFKFVVIAFIIALPITYFSMNSWLQNFAYRIDINYLTFLLAGVISLLIALSTVSYQIMRTALANPVKALRHE